jgi:uncharacterized protein (DUF885 family)
MADRMAVVHEIGLRRTINAGVAVTDEMQAYVDAAAEALAKHFACYPADPVVVVPVPGILSASGVRMGSAAQERPNQVQIRPGRDGVPYYLRLTIAHHEAYPGHYVQEYNQEQLSHLPDFRRYGNYRAYGEAWALYGEQLAWDVGLFDSADPLHKLGFVESKLWRSTIALTDVGLNSRRWSRNDAVDFLIQMLGMDDVDARTRVDRMLEDPGAATASYTGYLCYMAFRDHMRSALGDAFRLLDFHRLVLETGPAPMEILERVVMAYVEANDKR